MNPDAEIESNQAHKAALEPRLSFFFLLLVAAWVVQKLVPGLYLGYGILAVIGAFLAIYVWSAILRGEVEHILLGWVFLFPLGYYFLAFPKESPMFSFDRIVVGTLLLGMLFLREERSVPAPRPLRQSALAWASFVLAVALSFLQLKKVPNLSRVLVDAFFLPPLLGWYVIRNFRVRSHLVALHSLMCLMACYLAGIGLAEIITGEDIFPLGGGVYQAGYGGDLLFRPNGPFSSNQSFGLIGLISFCFLLFLRRTLPQVLPRWQRALHAVGICAAAITALLPLFRSIAITLLLILLLDIYSRRKRAARLLVLGLLISVTGIFLAVTIAFPNLVEERALSPANIYGRIAQQKQTIELFLEHPFMGVGFSNFTPAAQQLTNSLGSYRDVEALDSPHNNLGGVLAETGLLGFLPYLLSQILLFRAFWKMRRQEAVDTSLVWRVFLYVFLSYWITGLSLTSGYYLDLNIWFVFVACCLYKYGLTAEPQPSSSGLDRLLAVGCINQHRLAPSAHEQGRGYV